MADVPNWLKRLDTSPVLVVPFVVIAAAVVFGLVGGMPSGRALFPTTLAVFVLAMVALDLWRRRS